MADPREDAVLAHLRRSTEVLERTASDRGVVTAIAAIADRIAGAFRAGNKVMLAGNGGSAADAQHIAAEFLSRFVSNRAPLPALALTTDTSVLTAIGNDFGFEHVFERQVRGLGRRGDILIAISTSGTSPSVIAALKTAREIGVLRVGFTKAAKTPLHELCDLTLAVPSDEVALIQQVHIAAAHAICGLVERELFDTPKKG
jgi:D-sedoheptulose 7-phosphate isomerase